MSTNQQPWEPELIKLLLIKLLIGDTNEQYVAVLTLFKGINDNEIKILRDPSIPYNVSNLPMIVIGLLAALNAPENRDPKIREEIAKGLGDLGNILLNKMTKIRPLDTPQLLKEVVSIKQILLNVSQRDESGDVRRVALQAIEKMADKPWWKFW